jgi:hypothetical protein
LRESPAASAFENAQAAINEVIDVAGRVTIEAVLQLSAQEGGLAVADRAGRSA